MAVLFRVGLLVSSLLFLWGCGSEDAPRPGQSVSSGVEVPEDGTPPSVPDETPPAVQEPPPGEGDDDGNDDTPVPPEEPEPEEPEQPGEPGDESGDPGEEPVIPLPDTLDTNVFFPVLPGMGWYFDNNPQPFMLGAGQVQGSETIWPLEHGDILRGDFTSTADRVGLKGVNVLLLDQADPVYLDITFNTTRPILGDGNFNTTGSTRIRASGVPLNIAVPVRLTATLVGNEWVSIPGLGDQPARRIEVTLRLSVDWITRTLILLSYPWLAPAFDPVSFDLLFVAGVGVVGAQMDGMTTQAQGVIAIPAPLVFATTSGNLPAGQQLLVNGEPLTSMDWESTIFYRTAEENWLDVRFDSSGSWFADITRANLPKGIHAATVRFSNDVAEHDVTVSVMVE